MAEQDNRHWQGRTDGTEWMQRALVWLFRYLPLWLLYGVMLMVVPFYILFGRKGRKAIYDFYRRRMGHGRVKSVVYMCENFFRFGQVVLDRFAVFAGKKFNIELDRYDLFEQYDAKEDGFVILSAHVGCYEMAGYYLVSKNKQFNALVYGGESQTVMDNRAKILARNNIGMIVTSDDMSHIFAIHNALSSSQIVSIPADRIFGSKKVERCPFFGEEASFPAGPFAVARSHGAEMLAIFVMKEGMRRYRIIIREVKDVKEYAEVLEEVLRKYPEQWFNYFDFWEDGKAS